MQELFQTEETQQANARLDPRLDHGPVKKKKTKKIALKDIRGTIGKIWIQAAD